MTEVKSLIVIIFISPSHTTQNYHPKHWKTITRDKYLEEIFPKPPMVALKQPANLKNTGKCKITSHQTCKTHAWAPVANAQYAHS